jgi:hypothetical protein
MSAGIVDCLTERHLTLFGTIAQWFARHELLMQEIMATVIGSDSAAVMLLAKDLRFGEKHQALLRLLRHRNVPLDQFDVVRGYLKVPHALSKLRDDIVHSAWAAGPSPNSIQPDWILRRAPSIKPMHKAADTRPEDFKEDEDDRVEYTLDELTEIAETLRENHELLFNYTREVGLIDRGMDGGSKFPGQLR